MLPYQLVFVSNYLRLFDFIPTECYLKLLVSSSAPLEEAGKRERGRERKRERGKEGERERGVIAYKEIQILGLKFLHLSIFSDKNNRKKLPKLSPVPCPLSPVPCPLSPVPCPLSPVPCPLLTIIFLLNIP